MNKIDWKRFKWLYLMDGRTMICVGYMSRFGRATTVAVGFREIDILHAVNIWKNDNY